MEGRSLFFLLFVIYSYLAQDIFHFDTVRLSTESSAAPDGLGQQDLLAYFTRDESRKVGRVENVQIAHSQEPEAW